VDSAVRDAVVRVRHIGGSSAADRGDREWEGTGSACTEELGLVASLSLVAAICVSNEARRRRSSGAG
jgi:hypothetical protein